ncbi:MAG: type II toxin-antitoxin system prevent-host-death family antitoxin [Acidobacteria bacterium]|nr:type II toxin-antitoxin system prevent-host-death family antitoxin [Acidobacteriota bacterium]
MTVGAFEAKTKLSELLDRVERGEEVLITRHGTPVARLVSPVKAEVTTIESSSEDPYGKVSSFIRAIPAEQKREIVELIQGGRRF